MTFNEILLQERKRRGLSQEELAGMVNVSRQAVSKWETGDALPDLPKLLTLADALGLSLDALCGRTPPKSSSAQPTPQKPAVKMRTLQILLVCAAAALLLCVGILILSLSAPVTASPSALSATTEFTVAGLNFHGKTVSQVRYQFTPSISAKEVSYQIVFIDSNGKTFPIDAPCVSGICSGEAKLDGGYEGYSVSVSVTDGRITRSIPVANNLNFSPGNASWTPTT